VLQVISEKEISGITVIDSNGRLVLVKQLNKQQGYFMVSLPILNRGMYYVQLQTVSGKETVKIIVE
jgi:Secretion system C-terminal sorting domain